MTTFLAILYWLLIVLALINFFAPSDLWPKANTFLLLVLFVIIGLQIFRLPAH